MNALGMRLILSLQSLWSLLVYHMAWKSLNKSLEVKQTNNGKNLCGDHILFKVMNSSQICVHFHIQ